MKKRVRTLDNEERCVPFLTPTLSSSFLFVPLAHARSRFLLRRTTPLPKSFSLAGFGFFADVRLTTRAAARFDSVRLFPGFFFFSFFFSVWWCRWGNVGAGDVWMTKVPALARHDASDLASEAGRCHLRSTWEGIDRLFHCCCCCCWLLLLLTFWALLPVWMDLEGVGCRHFGRLNVELVIDARFCERNERACLCFHYCEKMCYSAVLYKENGQNAVADELPVL